MEPRYSYKEPKNKLLVAWSPKVPAKSDLILGHTG